MSSTEENTSSATSKQEVNSNRGIRGPVGHSLFLQKRLQKGQKYFDSGDYQMAKQNGGGGLKQVFANKVSTGEAIPTPETVPVRKTSILQQPNCNKYQKS